MTQEPDFSNESKNVIGRLTNDNFPLERYEPIELIGKGAAGNVLSCNDKVLNNRQVAVKVAHGILSAHVVDYQKEAKATSKLNHPNIVKIYDCGTTGNGIPYIAMEFIKGESLEDYLKRESEMEPTIAVSVFIKVCQALSYAHQQGVFHRDLKPSNILLIPNQQDLDIKIIDFGIAHISQFSNDPTVVQGRTIAGTPLYMSPDQLNNLPYDARSEVYSLGCIFFEALTGFPPYDASSSLELFSAHANLDIPSLGQKLKGEILIPELQDLIAKCMAKQREIRFQSVDDVKSALEEILLQINSGSKEGLEQDPNTPAFTRHNKRKYNKKNIAILLFTVLTGLAGIISLLFFSADKTKTNLPDQSNKERIASELETTKPLEKKLPRSIDDFKGNRNNQNWYMGKNDKGEDCIFAKQGSTDQDVEDLAFKEPAKIARVTIPYSSKITGTGFKKLKDHPIYLVTLKSKSLTDEGFKHVTELKHLAALVLADCGNLTDKGFDHLSNAHNLKYLFIIHAKLSPHMMAQIAKMSKLKHLGLYWNTYPDISAIQKLSKLKELENLSVTATNLKYIGFARKLKNLKLASFAITQIDDQELNYLTNLKLKELDIHETDITIKGVKKLNKIKTLEKLTVSLKNGITREGLRKTITLPKCVIDIHRNRSQ